MVKSTATTRRSGRRPGSPETRDQILSAARRQFIDDGFRAATMRSIASEAGVDPALVIHFFGSKENLFLESIKPPIDPSSTVAGFLAEDPDSAGRKLVEFLLDSWESEDIHRTMLGLVRAAVTEDLAANIVRSQIVNAVTEALRGARIDQPELRASLVGTQMAGIALGRYVIGFPALAAANRDAVIAAYAPVVQRFLTGSLKD